MTIIDGDCSVIVLITNAESNCKQACPKSNHKSPKIPVIAPRLAAKRANSRLLEKKNT